MYLREKKIKRLQMKNLLFICFSVFELFVCGTYIISEFTTYRDNPYVAWHAKSMASSIVLVIVCSVLLVQAILSRRWIGKATFFSGYFEGSLDGLVECSDLAKVTGDKAETVRKQMIFFRKHYMQKFELVEEKDDLVAELYSKKALCACKNCGATMEKRIYFTGICPYCGSSDLFAKVLADHQFYSIKAEVKSGETKPAFYLSGHLLIKKIWYFLITGFTAFLALIGFLMTVTEIPHYFDQEYQKELLLSPDNPLRSYALIRANILDNIIYASMMFLILSPVVVYGIKRIASMFTAKICAEVFAKSSKPFVPESKLANAGVPLEGNRRLRSIRHSIHKRDLVNCTLEVHEGKLMVALAKKIVKDKCPSCSGPIVGAVDENYVCQYCGRQIMGVVEKT